MYKIATLNKISPVGLKQFTDKYEILDGQDPVTGATGILVRSQNMLEMDFDDMLLAIGRAGAGVNNIPLDKCADQGIVVFNTPGANANSVKELVICALIMAARNVAPAIKWVAKVPEENPGDVAKAVEKGKSKFVGHEIKGATLGVIGLGAIGAQVAASALDLGMKVMGYDPFLPPALQDKLDKRITICKDIEEFVPQCDYITLHVPATKDTSGMVDKDFVSSMKAGAILLNFSRDKLVVEDEILAALDSGKMGWYFTDFATAGIIENPKVTCLPHLGASTDEAEDNCAVMAANELMNYIENGNIVNSVNFPRIDAGEMNCKTRAVVLTKGEPDPAKLIAALFADKNAKNVLGAVRGDYGVAILDTDDSITEVPEVPEVTKVRIITKD